MFGSFLGKLAALPVRIVNAPLRILDKVSDDFVGADPDDGSARISDAGESTADAIEKTVEEMLD